MQKVADGRRDANADPAIRPEPSTNMAARAGWMHDPDYAEVEVPAEPEVVPPTDAGVPAAEGAEGEPVDVPAEAPAAPAGGANG